MQSLSPIFAHLSHENIHTAEARVQRLKSLRQALRQHQEELLSALKRDLGKPRSEAYLTEFYPLMLELKMAIRKTPKWSRPHPVKSHFAFLGSHAYTQAEPLGRVLIYAPWNYPLLLLLQPLVNALSAGNCVLLSPSPAAPHTYHAVRDVLAQALPPSICHILEPGSCDPEELLSLPFDLVFYTGGPAYARTVAQRAGARLIPVVLELGGKSPCIVDRTADLPLAARRIAWGKLLNSGQTCVAPDYLLVHQDVLEQFTPLLIREMQQQLPHHSQDGLLQLVRPAEAEAAAQYLEGQDIIHGGTVDTHSGRMAPTIVFAPPLDCPLMQDELFLPILPIIPFGELPEALRIISARPKPLALYYFGKEGKTVQANTRSGSMATNDTVMQIAHPYLPFGGVGHSGMGRYHGEYGFEAFSNLRAVLKAGRRPDFA